MERHFRITVDGHPYTVTVEELADGATAHELHAPPPLPQPAPPPPAAAHAATHAAAPPAPAPALGAMPPASAGEVLATLGGVVESVAVKVGQAVNKGDVVMVLEAMKMNSPMVATRSGTITGLLVQPGDAVQAGQLLARIG
jgi:biotin carboxyl carrier protein